MKQKYVMKLSYDFERYTKQIGIKEDEKPTLITDRIIMDHIRSQWPDTESHRSTRRSYGICYRDKRTIFVNQNSRLAKYRQYKGAKYSEHYLRHHKMTYRDYQHTMVHELVHYRWDYLNHGAKFEKRIREILNGKIFPEVSLFSVPKEKADSIEEDEHNKIYGYLVNRTQITKLE